MKNLLAVLVAIFVGFTALNAQAQGSVVPFSATITLDLENIVPGNYRETNDGFAVYTDFQIPGTVTGDLVGTDTHIYNAIFKIANLKGRPGGTLTIQATSPCNGIFEGSYTGRSINGDIPDEDSGRFMMVGRGYCAGYQADGKYTEPDDGVLELDGRLVIP